MAHPTTVVILGGTGDLAKTKLFPAFFDLHSAGSLNDNFTIIGTSRKLLTQEEYTALVRTWLSARRSIVKEEDISAFLTHVEYLVSDAKKPEDYEVLAKRLYAIDTEKAVCSNKLFYCAVQPDLYSVVFHNLADSGLSVGCTPKADGWVRIVVEKPFGNDLTTSQELDTLLGLLFKEEQIFRMDHYLAKASLENILAFRFANSLFEPVWSKEHIERIEIRLLESKGIGDRGVFFDGVGQLRDVGQNHVLQMLALTLMEDPQSYQASSVREKRAEILGALTLVPSGKRVKGQYEGYTSEKGVQADSLVDTYFTLEARVDIPRWNTVPIILESGKGVSEDLCEIQVVFKEKKSFLCDPSDTEATQNVLTFRIQPHPSITMSFWTKKSGYAMAIEKREAKFPFFSSSERGYDAYEKILLDVLQGDQTLFTSSSEVQNAWRFISPTVTAWETQKPVKYARGAEASTITNHNNI